jgi:hypothetical protein
MAGATHVAVATDATPRGELAALQALRVVGEGAPRATRKARRVDAAGILGQVWEHARGSAAQARVAIDAYWAALLLPVAIDAGVDTLPALALLSGDSTPVETARVGLESVGLHGDEIGRLELFGLVWCDGERVHIAPSGQMLVNELLQAAPGLLTTGAARDVRATIEQVSVGVLTPERAIDRARALLGEVAPMPQVEAPDGFIEGRILGTCPSCGGPMRPVRRPDGRLRLTCRRTPKGCGLAYPLPAEAVAHPGGDACPCGAPRLRVHLRGWLSKPRCAAGDECTVEVTT